MVPKCNCNEAADDDGDTTGDYVVDAGAGVHGLDGDGGSGFVAEHGNENGSLGRECECEHLYGHVGVHNNADFDTIDCHCCEPPLAQSLSWFVVCVSRSLEEKR